MRRRTVFGRVLRRRIESCKHTFDSVDEVVAYLRSLFPEYSRHKLLPFTRAVVHSLEHMKSNNLKSRSQGRPLVSSLLTGHVENDDVGERLPLLENEHTGIKQNSIDQCTSSLSESIEDMDVASTLENSVGREKFEPEFDSTKSMLGASYNKSKDTSKLKEDLAEKNAEFEEVFRNKATTKIEFLGKDGGSGKSDRNYFSDCCGGGVEKVKGRNAPSFKDFGGSGGVLKELETKVIDPLLHPHLSGWLGVRPLRGILFHGPPGCGKTKLAHAIANEIGIPFYKVSAPELVSGVSGGSEENIRDLFGKAFRTAPSIVFIDEIDAIASKRENLQREAERRAVAQLMTCMDEVYNVVQPTDVDPNAKSSMIRPGYVLVIGATNRLDAIDPALRRPGRFDREIVLGVPDENARVEILSILSRDLRVEGAFDPIKLARFTPGFVGADLTALVDEARYVAMKRIIDRKKYELSVEPTDGKHIEDRRRLSWSPEEMRNNNITMDDFEEATKLVQPSLRREGFSTIPNVNWEDVGGLHLLRQEFYRYIVRRIKYPKDYEGLGRNLETGFLLYGPPGCGKTLIAKAVANEAGANFIHIKGPELLNKYVGESELAVRTIFSRARTCSPCVLFFDEVDALTTKPGRDGAWVVERLLKQFLIELDGGDERKGVYVIGATNRPQAMDPAVLRPGRLGKPVFVPLPSPDGRGLILKALARNTSIDAGVDLISIGRNAACKNFSGADLSAVMDEAYMAALDEKLTARSNSLIIKNTHLKHALKKISPSVSDRKIQHYLRLSRRFKGVLELDSGSK